MTSALAANDVFIVDDDEMMRDALSVVFTLAGYRVTGFATGQSFLTATRERTPVCVLLGLRLPDKSGMALLKELNAHSYPAPIFIVAGENDASSAVEALKSGSFDCLVKPFDARSIVARVGGAIAAFRNRSEQADAANFPGHHLLTPREREVLMQLAEGASNKEVGRRLGISPRTVEVHRARIMNKIGARNAADLVRIVLSAGRAGMASPPITT